MGNSGSVSDFAEHIGRWSTGPQQKPSRRLRREQRIGTIQASLAIENNSLCVE